MSKTKDAKVVRCVRCGKPIPVDNPVHTCLGNGNWIDSEKIMRDNGIEPEKSTS